MNNLGAEPIEEPLQPDEIRFIKMLALTVFCVIVLVIVAALFAIRLLGGLVFLAYAIYAINKTTTPPPN